MTDTTPEKRPSEVRLGLAEIDSDGRGVAHARGLFMRAVNAHYPHVLQALPLELYRYWFDRHRVRRELEIPIPPDPSSEQRAALAIQLGWQDDVISDDQVAREQIPTELYEPVSEAAPSSRYIRVHWCDPSASPDRSEQRRLTRLTLGLSLEDLAAYLNISPFKLGELERGCLPGMGLTTMTGAGAEELLTAMLQWGEYWHLTDPWCVDLGLEQLHNWPPTSTPDYSLDTAGLIMPLAFEPPRPRNFYPELEFDDTHLDLAIKQLKAFYANVKREVTTIGFQPSIRKRTAFYTHCVWLAQFQVGGESFADIWKSLPQGDERSHQAVEKAIHELAHLIGLTLRR